jgi:hypothetical protein
VNYKEALPLEIMGCLVQRKIWDGQANEGMLTFAMPSVDSKDALKALHDLVIERVGILQQDEIRYSPDRQMQRMQQASNVAVWLKRKEFQLRGRELLSRIDPSISMHGKRGLRVGRCLKILSHGSKDLLLHWTEVSIQYYAAVCYCC